MRLLATYTAGNTALTFVGVLVLAAIFSLVATVFWLIVWALAWVIGIFTPKKPGAKKRGR